MRAVVIRTGYITNKGQLVRSILYPPPSDFKFDRDSYKFIGILAFISFLGILYTTISKVIKTKQMVSKNLITNRKYTISGLQRFRCRGYNNKSFRCYNNMRSSSITGSHDSWKIIRNKSFEK